MYLRFEEIRTLSVMHRGGPQRSRNCAFKSRRFEAGSSRRRLRGRETLPTLAATYASMGLEMAIAQVLAPFGAVVVDHKENGPGAVAARSPMYYLLRLQQVAGESKMP